MRNILIVDSDQDIRQLLAEALPGFLPDFQFTFAADGEDAFDIFQKAGDPFALVVTGIEMPSLNGLQLASALKKLRPKLPVIIMSGMQEPENHRGDIFIKKPFSIYELSTNILQLLAARTQ